MKKLLVGLAGMVLMAGSLMAGTSFSFGIGIGAPVAPRPYYAPAPVYPAPAYVAPAYAAPAYPPPPAYYAPAPPCPGPGYSWVGGGWYWTGGHRYWRPGYWAAPRPVPYRGGHYHYRYR